MQQKSTLTPFLKKKFFFSHGENDETTTHLKHKEPIPARQRVFFLQNDANLIKIDKLKNK